MTTKTDLKALTTLRSAELTHDMDSGHLRKLASIVRVVEFEANEVIYLRGDKGKAVYLIEAGEVVIETDVPGQNPILLNRLGPGQFFGWSSLFLPKRKLFSTQATMLTRAIAFNASQVRSACQVDHALEYTIVRRAGQDTANRIKATRRQLAVMLTPVIG